MGHLWKCSAAIESHRSLVLGSHENHTLNSNQCPAYKEDGQPREDSLSDTTGGTVRASQALASPHVYLDSYKERLAESESLQAK